jgi:hypothetical protein
LTAINSQVVDRWFIRKPNRELGFIDSLGNEIFTDKFDILDEKYNSGLVFFEKNEKRGYLDKNGKIVFKSKKVWLSFSEGFIAINDADNFYYLNTSGECAINLTRLKMPERKEISKIFNFHNGLAMVRIKDKGFDDSDNDHSCFVIEEEVNLFPGNWLFGFINKNGEWKIMPTLDNASSFSDGISIARKNEVTYFMDLSGDFITKLDYPWYVGEYSEGFAIVYKTDSCFFINKNGKKINNLVFKRANPFSDGMASIEINDKWGFIDTTGQIVIKPKYHSRGNFSEGLAPVSLEVREKGYSYDSYFMEGIINKKDEIVVPFEKHVNYGRFINGLIKGDRTFYAEDKQTIESREYFYMDNKGKKIWSTLLIKK